MTIDALLQQLKNTPESVQFDEVIAAIDENYNFVPTAFTNGDTQNSAEQNNGSCKIFAFAQLLGLNEAQTLACFGRFYREDVLGNPEGDDHQNIRNFIQTGWAGIAFADKALALK